MSEQKPNIQTIKKRATEAVRKGKAVTIETCSVEIDAAGRKNYGEWESVERVFRNIPNPAAKADAEVMVCMLEFMLGDFGREFRIRK